MILDDKGGNISLVGTTNNVEDDVESPTYVERDVVDVLVKKTSEPAQIDEKEEDASNCSDDDDDDETKIPPKTCPACFQEPPPTSSYTLEGCNHKYCQECITQYIKNQVEGGQFLDGNIQCFQTIDMESGITCDNDITQNDISNLLQSSGNEEIYERYNRLRYDKENPLSRRCPKCDLPRAFDGKKAVIHERGNVSCAGCGQVYCPLHSNAHVGRTCEEYEEKVSKGKTMKSSSKALGLPVMKCPSCGIIIAKDGGCQHMFCTACRENFNWIDTRQSMKDFSLLFLLFLTLPLFLTFVVITWTNAGLLSLLKRGNLQHTSHYANASFNYFCIGVGLMGCVIAVVFLSIGFHMFIAAALLADSILFVLTFLTLT